MKSAPDQALVDAYIAKHGVKKLPPATGGDPKAIAAHQEQLDRQRREQREMHSQTRARKHREETSASAARAKDAVARGDGVVQPKPDPTRASWNQKADLRPASRSQTAPTGTKIAALKAARTAAPGFDPGTRPEMRWIEVELLDVDHVYQRMLSPKHAKKLASDFKWVAFQPLTVTPTKGARYAVIDGQHRLQAAKAIVQVVELPCYVVPKVDQKGQAAAFLETNNSHKAVSSLEKFRAGIVGCDGPTLTIKNILGGLDIKIVSGSAGPMETTCVSRLYRMLKAHGPTVLLKALTAIVDAWPREREGLSEQYILALCVVFSREPETKPERAVAVLRQIKPAPFVAEQLLKGKGIGMRGTAMVTGELFRRITGREWKR